MQIVFIIQIHGDLSLSFIKIERFLHFFLFNFHFLEMNEQERKEQKAELLGHNFPTFSFYRSFTDE